MKELLACKDLRLNDRVIAAYWGLLGGTKSVLCFAGEESAMYPPIPGSLADVAFEMRNACVKMYWFTRLQLEVGEYHDGEEAIKYSTPEHWIIAATLAWEAKETK